MYSKTEIIALKSIMILIMILMVLMVVAMFMTLFWTINAQDYETNNIVDCNDEDGDVIQDLICHDVVRCSTNLKFLNYKGCEDFIK